MTVLQLRGPMGFCVLQWCHPMLACGKEDKLLNPDHHLIRYAKSGFRPAQPVAAVKRNHPPTLTDLFPAFVFFTLSCTHPDGRFN